MEANKELTADQILEKINNKYGAVFTRSSVKSAMEEYAEAKIDAALHKERNDMQAKFSEQAKEYPSKLHLLQQECNKLRLENNKAAQALITSHDSWNQYKGSFEKIQQEYDKLKGKFDGLELSYNELKAEVEVEHKALKEKADKMAEALDAYIKAQSRMLEKWADGDNKVKHDLWLGLHACEIKGREALASYNSNTNQNENNG